MTGRCPVCGREITITRDKRIRTHGTKDPTVWPPRACPGTGRPAANRRRAGA